MGPIIEYSSILEYSMILWLAEERVAIELYWNTIAIMDVPNTKKGNTLIMVLAIALLILLTVGTAAIVFTNVFDNIFAQREAARDGQGLMERAQENYDEFQREK